jgi:ketosteroid isomerase-like protein
MSQENVELMERAIAAFNRKDIAELEDLSSQDFEFFPILAGVDGVTYRGSGAWAHYFAARDEIWSMWQIENFEIHDTADDRLACLFTVAGEGRLSGTSVNRRVGMTCEMRDGRLRRIRAYATPADALEAVGLSE